MRDLNMRCNFDKAKAVHVEEGNGMHLHYLAVGVSADQDHREHQGVKNAKICEEETPFPWLLLQNVDDAEGVRITYLRAAGRICPTTEHNTTY